MQHERKRGERRSLSCNPENKFNTPEDSFHYTTKLYNSTQWLLEAEEAAKRRFLTGILVQCQSQEVLHNVQKVLQVTMGKDFTYARSRVKASDTVGHFKTLIPDVHLLGKEMLDTWEWFKNSTDVTKTNYLFGLLAFCDAEMLHMLGNLACMLIEKHNLHLLQCKTVLPSTEKDSSSVTESNESFRTSHDLDLLARASSVPHETRDNTESDLLDTKGSGWSVVEEIDWNDVKDPALMVVPISSRYMSGICKQRDFIRALPVGLAKRILGLLDKDTLQKCKQVSQHWRYLTEETIAEQSVKKMVEEQAMILQGIPSVVNPAYARIRKVLVPFRLGEVFMQPKKSFQKSKDIRGFEAVYTKIKTKVVEMEERNVYCGVYNSLIMLDREDHSRVIHYDGGSKVVLGSRDRLVRLLDMVLLKEVPPRMYGHAGSVRAVLVCEERELVISASYDLSIRCWNMKTGTCMMLFSGHMGTITCLDLNRNYLVSGARDCKVKVWNLQTGQCCDRMRFCHRKPVVCVKTDSTLVLSGCEEGLIKMWDMETANLLKVTQSHQGSVRCLFLDQFHILSGGSDSKVLAWSTDRQFKKCLMTFQHPREVVTVSSLFLRVITGCVDGRIRIFNLLSGDCLRVIKIGTDESPIRSLHTHHNTIVVNSSSRVLSLQFSEQQWDYSAPPERIMDHTLPQHKIPAALPSSTKPKKNERRSRTLSLSQRMRNLSAPSMHHLHEKHYLAQRCLMTPSERAVRERLRKKSPHQSITPTQVFLKVRPRRQPEFKGSPSSAQKASKRSHSASKPSSFEGTLKIYTPLKTDMHPSIPSPALLQTLPKSASTHPHTACATTTTTQEPRISFIKGESKHPSHHVDFETPARSRQIHCPLDPFRESGGFQLRTDTQLEEYNQAQMQANLYTLPKEGKKRQCRASWRLKVKVAPVKDA